jgi:hypothetical protein
VYTKYVLLMELTSIEIMQKGKRGVWDLNKGVNNVEKCGVCREKSSPFNASNCSLLAAPV